MKGVKKCGCGVQTVWSKCTQMKMEGKGTLNMTDSYSRHERFECKNSKMQLCCLSFNKQWRLPFKHLHKWKKVGRGWGRSKAVPLAREKIKHFYCVCHIQLVTYNFTIIDDFLRQQLFCACKQINHDEKGLRTFIETDNTQFLSLSKLLARLGGLGPTQVSRTFDKGVDEMCAMAVMCTVQLAVEKAFY